MDCKISKNKLHTISFIKVYDKYILFVFILFIIIGYSFVYTVHSDWKTGSLKDTLRNL